MPAAAAEEATALPDADEINPEEFEDAASAAADAAATAANGDGCGLPAAAVDGVTADELADVVILFADT